MTKIITFGELMLRLQLYNCERFARYVRVEFAFGDGSGRIQR